MMGLRATFSSVHVMNKLLQPLQICLHGANSIPPPPAAAAAAGGAAAADDADDAATDHASKFAADLGLGSFGSGLDGQARVSTARFSGARKARASKAKKPPLNKHGTLSRFEMRQDAEYCAWRPPSPLPAPRVLPYKHCRGTARPGVFLGVSVSTPGDEISTMLALKMAGRLRHGRRMHLRNRHRERRGCHGGRAGRRGG